MALALIQQITGINTLLYYAPSIFTVAGFSTASDAIYAMIFIGICFTVSTAVSLPLIDRLGRKPLLYIGMSMMAAALGYMAFGFSTGDKSDLQKEMIFYSMLIYICGFAISLGPIVWLMISEIFPLRYRGRGSSLATACHWGSNALISYSFLTLVNLIGMGQVFGLYFIVTVASIAYIYFFVPETKGVRLEDIEAQLLAQKPLIELGQESTKEEERCISA